MSAHYFTGQAALAARFLYENTPLRDSELVTAKEVGRGFVVAVLPDGFLPPTEQRLINILGSLGDLNRLDDLTAWAAWWAIGLSRGLTAEVAMVRDLTGGAV